MSSLFDTEVYQRRNHTPVQLSLRNKDGFIMKALADGHIEVDAETGKIYSRRVRGKAGQLTELPGARIKGYIVHKLYIDKVIVQLYAHRIVWIAVNGPIPVGFEPDHINRIHDDNRISNLRLVAPIENKRNRRSYKGEDSPSAKLTSDQVLEIRRLYSQENTTVRRLARQFRISKSQIHNIVSGKSWALGRVR